MYQLKNLIKKIIKPCIIAGSCQHVLIDSFVVKKVKNRLQGEHLCLINYELRRIWQDIGLHHHSPVTVIVSFILYLPFDTTGAQSPRCDYVLSCFCWMWRMSRDFNPPFVRLLAVNLNLDDHQTGRKEEPDILKCLFYLKLGKTFLL